jgi:hypothetical protein
MSANLARLLVRGFMSALGQERTSRRIESMSALPSRADFSRALGHVPLGANSGHSGRSKNPMLHRKRQK